MNSSFTLTSVEVSDIERYFDTVASRYYCRDNKQEGLFWRNLDVQLIRSHLPRKRNRFIDLGCGAGFYSNRLHSFFKESFLIDKSQKMISIAKKNLQLKSKKSVSFIHGDFQCTPFKAKSISFVLATGASICYGENSLSLILKRVYRLLDAGGRFYFEVWNKPGILITTLQYKSLFFNLFESVVPMKERKIDQFLKDGKILENSLNLSVTVRTYTVEEILRLIERTGFKLVTIFGRKVTTVLLRGRDLRKIIAHYPRKLIRVERVLSRYPEIISISPKVVFVVEKKSL